MTDVFNQNVKNIRKKLKILVIIHGFPPYYMAGSEVYTFNKCVELSKRHEIFVFTRIEDEFQNSYSVTQSIENGLRIIRVNKPERDYTFRKKYEDFRMAEIFKEFLEEIQPDIVHINHLSHLTTLIINIVSDFQIPIVFTLHDYWMICIRGQLIKDDYSICNGPNIERCTFCNMKYFTSKVHAIQEIQRWLKNFDEINKKVNVFIAPSRFLRKMYINFGINENEIIYMDYGFDKDIIYGIKKNKSSKIRFGFLGRIIPVKGISLLINAFNMVDHSRAELNLFGKLPNSSLYLQERCENLPIYFKGEYYYRDLAKILSNIDILIVPSIWYENSPLVIHEAFLAKIPVITSNLGGMSELVSHEKNGLLFEPGNVKDLRKKMNLFIENPILIEKYSQETYVRSIQEDVKEIEKIYFKLLRKKEGLIIVY